MNYVILIFNPGDNLNKLCIHKLLRACHAYHNTQCIILINCQTYIEQYNVNNKTKYCKIYEIRENYMFEENRKNNFKFIVHRGTKRNFHTKSTIIKSCFKWKKNVRKN